MIELTRVVEALTLTLKAVDDDSILRERPEGETLLEKSPNWLLKPG